MAGINIMFICELIHYLEKNMIDINNLTLGQIKEIQSLCVAKPIVATSELQTSESSLNCMIGKKVIVRTYAAGVWFGDLEQKAGNEVIVKNARRMWRWHAAESISLSAVANHGIKHNQSKIAEAVSSVWLEAIEIIPCTDKSIKSIEAAENVKAD